MAEFAAGVPVDVVHILPNLLSPAWAWRFELDVQGGEVRVLFAVTERTGAHATTLGSDEAGHVYPGTSSGAVCVVELEPGAPVTVSGTDDGLSLAVDVNGRSFTVSGAVVQVRPAGLYAPVETNSTRPSVVYRTHRGF